MLERWRTSLLGLLRAVSYSHLLLAKVPEGRRLTSKSNLEEKSWMGVATLVSFAGQGLSGALQWLVFV